MSAEVFTEEWAREWCAALNGSETYRAAAATWEGSVALVMRSDAGGGDGGDGDRAVFLDLWHGECRAARRATADDLVRATYVLEATASDWRELLEGRMVPAMALLAGRLRLTRGSLATLLPYVGAARELVATATALGRAPRE